MTAKKNVSLSEWFQEAMGPDVIFENKKFNIEITNSDEKKQNTDKT